jgi:hypothetical protein
LFEGVSESPSLVRMPLPLSIDLPHENELRKLSPRENRRYNFK